jgi:hypothetical protein
VSGAAQLAPHAPQLLLDVDRSAHTLLVASQHCAGAAHCVLPHGQAPVAEQLPSTQQSCPAGQAALLPQ